MENIYYAIFYHFTGRSYEFVRRNLVIDVLVEEIGK